MWSSSILPVRLYYTVIDRAKFAILWDIRVKFQVGWYPL
jgi:hypothetical protein